MNTFATWGEAIRASWQTLWFRFIDALPSVLGAIVILIIGFLLAGLLSTLAKRVIQMLRIDAALERAGITARMQSFGMKFSLADVIAWIVRWFVIIATLTAVADMLNWEQVTDFLAKVAAYIPNIFVSVIILLVGLVLGRFLREVVERAIMASRLPNASAGMLGTVAEWAVIIFALMATMTQLGIATRLIEILFTGLVAGLALAFGLSFGLGGRDRAAKMLDKVSEEAARTARDAMPQA